MDEELSYPELPEGYVWKKRGEKHPMDPFGEDADIWYAATGEEKETVVAWVRQDPAEDTESGVPEIWARNRNSDRMDHGKPTPVSSYQEGINLIHAQLMLGLIGVGKCLEEE